MPGLAIAGPVAHAEGTAVRTPRFPEDRTISMRQRLVMSWLVTIVALGVRGAPALSAEARPNIVLIYADDTGWGDVSFNGRKEWKTPNLDRLGGQGTIFRRWYTGAVVCAPSRAAMLTGKYSIHNGVSR